MSYNDIELSTYDSAPIELYHFSADSPTPAAWYYTSAEEDVLHLGKTYRSTAISRTPVEWGSEVNKTNMTVTAPRDIDVSEMFRAQSPGFVVGLVVMRRHRHDTEAETIWIGRVLGAEWKRGGTVELYSESALTAVKRMGLSRIYQRPCPHILYKQGDGLCNVIQQSFRHSLLITWVVDNKLTVTGSSNVGIPDYFTGGMVEWVSPNGLGRVVSMIEQHEHLTGNLTMNSSIRELRVGMHVDVSPGCNHTITACHTKFFNHLNYGGFPYMPLLNPFHMTTLF